jgi:hypothetical protein
VGLNVDNAGYHYLLDVQIQRTGGHGIQMDQTPDWFWSGVSVGAPGEQEAANSDAVHLGSGSVGLITNSKFWQAYRGIYSESALFITNSEVEKTRLHGIELRAQGSQVNDVLFTKINTSGASAGAGIHVVSANNTFVGNHISDDLGNMKYGIREFGAFANNNIISDNFISDASTAAISRLGANTMVRDNLGYVTESSGTSTIANAATSTTVTHGLSVTPTANDCSINPTNNLGTAAKFWTSDFDADDFTINVDADPGATTATFAWTCQVL